MWFRVRKIVIALFLCLHCYASFSQFTFGLRGGPQITDLYFNQGNVSNWRPAYHIGIFGKYAFSEKIALLVDVLYTDKGGKSKNGATLHLDYISVPIMAQYNIVDKFSVLIGGGIGVQVASYSMQGRKFSEKDLLGNPLDTEVVGGLCYNINPRLNIMLRYMHGLANVLTKDANTSVGTPGQGVVSYNLLDLGYKYQNRVLQLSIGYTLKGKEN